MFVCVFAFMPLYVLGEHENVIYTASWHKKLLYFVFCLGCSQGYKLDLYDELRHINSEVNEQQNASTQKLKNQLSYMSSATFMKHCRFFIWYRNKLKQSLH